ncbi:ribose ABC transporter ATP-binding protein RbsA [Caldisalinibacter kiritimatiensis]|uniref:Ribose ABC transport system, ATP-binding protein RbsA n=1 Tax=Caldisalinibacter kiritimatiensis TaxID=1304284 RepID=R1CYW9_9FIRM|nr:ribose ABC transporter ATP-binding protein RbsA [Caldisalinibacter kiritimatiensis]EOD01779.1 Ribose ABC transport system, ATP-binding protein RbsA [Caldisalinibacter kiritimatiensis]
MKDIVLEMKNITKEFPGVKALDNVNLRVYKGNVMALLGENGAGKSTLMKILSGVYKKDVGKIIYEGKEVEFKTPKESQEKGISIIHQELNLIPELTIGENIFLGREPLTSFRKIDWDKLYKDSKELLNRLGVDEDPRKPVSELSIGQQQMVEIAKALSLNAKIIIMDEPTDALTDKETESLFKVINELKNEGRSIIYISHRLNEIFEICDDVTVLRDGEFIGENSINELNEDKIIEMMVGRKLTEQFPRVDVEKGDVVLKVKELSNDYVKNINFTLRRGEILGISGLMGAGRTELAKTIFGALKKESGEIYLEGKEININSPKDALKEGIAYVSEDRKSEGLILGLSVAENMSISSLKQLTGFLGKIDRNKEKKEVEGYVDKISIKTPSIEQKIKNLSGGNQQKVAIAKSLMTSPKVLILDEPTRGVDVGAKKEIYDIINKFKKEGMSIIMISSEIQEILGMSDRILVMHDGEITGELDIDNASQETIMKHAVGIKGA